MSERHTLLDLAPTVGALLGFATREAKGEVMRGVFADDGAWQEHPA